MNILEYENYHESKTHGKMNFPYNTYLCSIPLDFRNVPSHWHEELEIIYIKKGKGTVSVDFQSYEIQAPAIILILPGRLHSIRQWMDERMEYENIIFHPSMLIPRKNDSPTTDFLLPLLNGKISVPTVFTPAAPYYQDIAAAIDACDAASASRSQGYGLAIKSCLYQFFFILDNRCRNQSSALCNRHNLDRTKRLLKYVENHYMDRISITEIAGVAGFSESHFMRFFKETMGVTFVEYLKDYRLTMAARLLSGSDSAILAVATETGFDNLSYFNRSFKQKYQMTPKEYRKQGAS